MPRHALAPLFDPRTLLILGDRPIPLADAIPPGIAPCTTRVDCQPGDPFVLPPVLNGVSPGSRLDLALICMPPQTLPDTLCALSAARPRAVIILAHDVVDAHPDETREACRAWAVEHGCAMVGPNAFGVQRPHAGLNLSQHPLLARSGRVALVAQFRSIVASVMDWADDVHVGFSTVVALSNESVTRLSDVLDFLATDPRTDSIVLCLEDVGFAREFISALRAAASVKPVIVLKAGRSNDSADADAAFDAALRRAGAVRVRYFIQVFGALKVLGYARRPKGNRIAVLSNGYGPPQLALDVIGSTVPAVKADLSSTSRRSLGKLLEPGAVAGNPVITHQPLNPQLTRELLNCLLEDPAVDGVMVLISPDVRADLEPVADELAVIAPKARKPVITCFLGDASVRGLRRRLDDAGTPAFRTPESAASAFGFLAAHHYNQQLLLQVQTRDPEADPPDLVQALALIVGARADGRIRLTPQECRAMLGAFHLPLQLSDSQSQGGLEDMVPMAMGLFTDRRFGPIVRFGVGGAAASLQGAEGGMDLAPLNHFLAGRLVERTVIWRNCLAGQVVPQAYDALLSCLERLSTMAAELPDIEEVRIDPLIPAQDGLRALQVQVTLHMTPQGYSPQSAGYPHMAIHPYPSRWVQELTFADGREWTLRPIRPEDVAALQEFIRSLTKRSRYMRFVSMMRELTPRMLARYTQIDYHRELALVATTHVANPANRGHTIEIIIGLAHYLRNPDGRGAEYALVIGDDWQRRGLGAKLMNKLIDAATEQGLEYIDGMVIGSNQPMLSLMTWLGFTNDPDPEDPAMRKVWMALPRGS